MRYVAVVKAEDDVVQVFNVYEKESDVFNLNDDLRRPVLPEMQLSELIVEFPSNFKGQLRHITGSTPPQYCNGKLHKLQILVTYANYFVEVVEIYPSDLKVASYQAKGFYQPPSDANIERNYIHSYGGAMSFYPPFKEDLLPKVQVVYISEKQTFFAFVATHERGKFLVYDLQNKIIVHKFELNDG